MLLDPGEYVTFKQVQEAKGKVKKGAKSEIVVFWKWIEAENKDTGKEEKIPFLSRVGDFLICDFIINCWFF